MLDDPDLSRTVIFFLVRNFGNPGLFFYSQVSVNYKTDISVCPDHYTSLHFILIIIIILIISSSFIFIVKKIQDKTIYCQQAGVTNPVTLKPLYQKGNLLLKKKTKWNNQNSYTFAKKEKNNSANKIQGR